MDEELRPMEPEYWRLRDEETLFLLVNELLMANKLSRSGEKKITRMVNRLWRRSRGCGDGWTTEQRELLAKLTRLLWGPKTAT